MILSVDLGATNIKAALFDKNLNKIGQTLSVPTRADGGRDGIVSALKNTVNLFKGKASVLAVSSAGDVDVKTSRITYATDNLPGMTGFDFVGFGQTFSLPAYAINDAQAALLGEVYCGAGREFKDKSIVMLTLGSGVGGAYFSGGKIVAGKSNMFGRYGHLILHSGGRYCTCGKYGCVETYLSGRAIHLSAAQLNIDGNDIFEKYLNGSSRHVEFVNGIIGELKLTLEAVEKISPFDVCIIGGGVADWMGVAFEKIAKGTGYPLVKAQLGNDAGLYGACVNLKSMRGEL